MLQNSDALSLGNSEFFRNENATSPNATATSAHATSAEEVPAQQDRSPQGSISDPICRRTRANFSLEDMQIEELERLLVLDEDYDEDEGDADYRAFLAVSTNIKYRKKTKIQIA